MMKFDRIAALFGLLLVCLLATLAGCPIDATTILFPSSMEKPAPVDASTPPPVPPPPARAYPTHVHRAVDTSTHDQEPERIEP